MQISRWFDSLSSASGGSIYVSMSQSQLQLLVSQTNPRCLWHRLMLNNSAYWHGPFDNIVKRLMPAAVTRDWNPKRHMSSNDLKELRSSIFSYSCYLMYFLFPCCLQRNEDPHLIPLNLLILLVGRYFDQTDMADQGWLGWILVRFLKFFNRQTNYKLTGFALCTLFSKGT
jgi:hypothetical protein